MKLLLSINAHLIQALDKRRGKHSTRSSLIRALVAEFIGKTPEDPSICPACTVSCHDACTHGESTFYEGHPYICLCAVANHTPKPRKRRR